MKENITSKQIFSVNRSLLAPLLVRATSKLRDSDKQFIILYYYEELSIDEIANRLGEYPGAIRKRHLQIIKRLRKLLKQEFRRSIKELEFVKSPNNPNIQRGLWVVREALESIS
jgi:DNA-directed RNA polymerase specialized sigma24 family protein